MQEINKLADQMFSIGLEFDRTIFLCKKCMFLLKYFSELGPLCKCEYTLTFHQQIDQWFSNFLPCDTLKKFKILRGTPNQDNKVALL